MDDADVVKCLKMLTFLPLEEIEELAKLEGSEINKAKEVLAHELTELIHGKEEADKAQEAARALFGSKQNTDNMPSTEIDRAALGGDEDVIVVAPRTNVDFPTVFVGVPKNVNVE